MMIDILSGVLLTGAASGQEVIDLYDQSERHQGLGHFFIAIDVTAFYPPETFQARVEHYAEQVRMQPRVPGVEQILLPGRAGAFRSGPGCPSGHPAQRHRPGGSRCPRE